MILWMDHALTVVKVMEYDGHDGNGEYGVIMVTFSHVYPPSIITPNFFLMFYPCFLLTLRPLAWGLVNWVLQSCFKLK